MDDKKKKFNPFGAFTAEPITPQKGIAAAANFAFKNFIYDPNVGIFPQSPLHDINEASKHKMLSPEQNKAMDRAYEKTILGGVVDAPSTVAKPVNKAVQAAIEPLTLYHGGDKIDKVDLSKSNFDKTFYMTDDPEYAKSFGGRDSVVNEMTLDPNARIIDMRKPTETQLKEISDAIKVEMAKPAPYGESFSFYPYSTEDVLQGIKDGKAHFAELPQIKKILRDLGYDGQVTSEVPYAKNVGVWNDAIVSTKGGAEPFQGEKTNSVIRQEPTGYGELENLVARERFNIPELKKLSGGGSDRDVYDLGDGRVLKVAKTARGLRQNDFEGDMYAPVPEKLETGKNYVVVEKVNPPNERTKQFVNDYREALDFNSRQPAVDALNKLYDKYENDEQIMSLITDLQNYDLMYNDLAAIRNWGSDADGNPVLLDAGTLGGNSLLDEYRNVKNLDNPDFREVYNQSRTAKKKYNDKDKNTMYGWFPFAATAGLGAGALGLQDNEDDTSY